MKGTTLAIFGLLGTSIALAGTGLYYEYKANSDFVKASSEISSLLSQTADKDTGKTGKDSKKDG